MTSIENEAQRDIAGIHDYHAHPELAPPLYRLLAAGEPVSVERLAAEAGWNAEDLQEEYTRDSGVEWDDDGRIVGFGMTLRPTPHTFTFDGRTVYASCADAAFTIPIILGRPGVIESPCAATGRRIRVVVTPTGVVSLDPPEAVVSRVSPTEAVADAHEICALGNFISSPEDGARWLAHYPQGQLVTVADDFEIVRRVMTELGLAAERPRSNRLASYTECQPL